jgi:hypothetical protein
MSIDPIRSPLPMPPVKPVRQEEQRRERQPPPHKESEHEPEDDGDTGIDEYA